MFEHTRGISLVDVRNVFCVIKKMTANRVMSVEERRNEIDVELRNVLQKVSAAAGKGFSGVGVIVWDQVSAVPVMPMRATASFDETRDSWRLLAEFAEEESPLHDGFHVLSRDLKLLAPSVYFSPPIVKNLGLPATSTGFGGRYLAAMYGSCLQGVLCTGVLSRKYGVRVFVGGKER